MIPIGMQHVRTFRYWNDKLKGAATVNARTLTKLPNYDPTGQKYWARMSHRILLVGTSMVNPVPNTVGFQLILDREDGQPNHGDQMSGFLVLTTYRGELKIGFSLIFHNIMPLLFVYWWLSVRISCTRAMCLTIA